MKYSYDLHIHSVLSPCADELQTPNNILNMCMLKGLNIVAVTDHNSLKQLPILDGLKDSYNFLYVYGVEVTVLEGFHVIIYLENLDDAIKLDTYLEKCIKDEEPNSKQTICDIYDNYVNEYHKSLNCILDLSYIDLLKIIRKLNGIIILAHLDRSLLINKSYIDIFDKLDFDAIELTKLCNINIFFNTYPIFKNYKYLINSDAHTLMEINESNQFINLEDLTYKSLKSYLRKQND